MSYLDDIASWSDKDVRVSWRLTLQEMDQGRHIDTNEFIVIASELKKRKLRGYKSIKLYTPKGVIVP